MHITRLRLLAIALLLAVTPAASASQALQANAVLLSAMSPFEDLIGFALAESDADISHALVAADQHATAVKTALSASAASEFATLMEGLHRAATDKDHHHVARSAVDVFRLLIDNLKATDLKVPKEVSLLDYAGFKLRVLAATPRPDWQDIRRTVGEAAGWWNAINAQVSAQGLRDAFGSVMRGLDEATKLENLPMLRFAAQIDLDLVDLLEGALKPKR